MSAIRGIFKQYNRKLDHLMLDANNTTIVSVVEQVGPNGENTMAVVRVDKNRPFESIESTNEFSEEDRWAMREVFFTRRDLGEVLSPIVSGLDLEDVFNGLPATDGKSDAHRDAFLQAIQENVNLSPSEVNAYVVGQYVNIVATPESLGFIGSLSLDTEGAPLGG